MSDEPPAAAAANTWRGHGAQDVNHVPPGQYVAHGTALVAEIQSAMAAGYQITPPFFHAASWGSCDRQPEYQGNPQNAMGRLLSRLFNGACLSIGLTYRSGGTKRLVIELEVPNNMTYEMLAANLPKLARELSEQSAPPTDPGRRKLLKLEEEA